MIALSAQVIGANLVSKQLDLIGKSAGPKIARKVTYWGHILEGRIKSRASGRPGPRAITGDYRRSWNTEVRANAHGAEAIVGTNKPQARRLEFGFAGVDSLGRHYNQPPFPHVNPAAGEIEAAFHADLASVIT